MTLQRLLSTGFAKGCGVSMESAMATPRYLRLVALNHNTKDGTPQEMAQIALYGEMIADRAAENLPIVVRNRLHWWRQGPEQQLALLGVIEKSMTSRKWKAYGQRKSSRRRYGTIESVYPAVTKSWERGPVQPNCLGIAQMLVGFARKVKARHYLVTVLKTDTMYNDELYLSVIDEAIKELKPIRRVPEIKRLLGKLEKERVRVLKNIDFGQRLQAHHALMIQLADGSWYLLDPYSSLLNDVGIKRQKQLNRLLGIVDSNPKRCVVAKLPHTPKGSFYYNALCNHQVSLDAARRYFAKRNRRKAFDNDVVDDLAYYIALYGLGLTAKERRAFDPNNCSKELGDVFYHSYFLIREYAYVPPARRAQAIAISRKTKERVISQEEFKSYVAATRRDRARYKRAQYRVLRAVVQLMVDQIHYLSHEKAARMHSLIEISHPTLALGCATLNHQQVKSRTHLHGRLALYTTNEWILHDILAAHRRGDVLDATSTKVIKKRAKELSRRKPEMTLDQLKPLLEGW